MKDYQVIGASAELIVAYRFVESGRPVAWPLVTSRYDLIVDGGSQLFRVQIKRGNQRDDGGLRVRFKNATNPESSIGMHFDYVCVVKDAGTIYVIPSAACECAHRPGTLVATLEIRSARFDAYLNRFDIGTGRMPAMSREAVIEANRLRRITRTQWGSSKRYGDGRKPHHRVTALEAQEIFRLRDLMPLELLAQQFGVTPQTVRNIARGRRRDLSGLLT